MSGIYVKGVEAPEGCERYYKPEWCPIRGVTTDSELENGG